MMTHLKSVFVVAATSMGLIAMAHSASTLTSGGQTHLVAGDVDDPYVISVNSTNAGFANDFSASSNAAFVDTTVTQAFNGAVYAYRFANVTGGSGSRTLNSVVDSGGIVNLITSTDTADNNGFDSFGQQVSGYTTTDPGAFLTDAGALTTAEGSKDFNAGIRDLDDFTGTIDITGLASGSIYLFSGNYNAGGFSITATMSGTALTDVLSGELHGGGQVGGQNIFATRIDFVNDEGYDTITYTSSGSRYVGTVVTNVTAVPEPSSMAVFGLGGLLCLLRRRR